MATGVGTASHRWLVWVVALAISLVAVSGIRTLLHWCNDSHLAVALLNRLDGQINRLNALEWETVARRGLSEDDRENYLSVHQELGQTFGELESLVAGADLTAIRQLSQQYLRVTKDQFQLLDLKRFDEAQRLDDEKVDPTYDMLIARTWALREQHVAAGQRTKLLVDIGISAVLLMAAIATGILFSRFEQSRRGREILLAEQNALRQSEIRFRSLVQNSSEVIAILSPLPPTVLFISDSVRRILGHGSDRLTGTDFSKLVHPDDKNKMQSFLAKCSYSGGITHTVEVRLRRGDGQWSQVEIFGDNRLGDLSVGGIVINFRDISETRLIEAALSEEGYEFDPVDRKLH